jgi:hypothetical protein
VLGIFGMEIFLRSVVSFANDAGQPAARRRRFQCGAKFTTKCQNYVRLHSEWMSRCNLQTFTHLVMTRIDDAIPIELNVNRSC